MIWRAFWSTESGREPRSFHRKASLRKKIFKLWIVLFLVAFLCVVPNSSAFAQPQGVPFHTQYSPQEFESASEVWNIQFDDRGQVWASTNENILHFNGNTWAQYEVGKAGKGAYSMHWDTAAQTVFWGADADFGWLKATPEGRVSESFVRRFHLDTLPINTVYSVWQHKGATFFQDDRYLFKYQQDTLVYFDLGNTYHRSFVVEGTPYLRVEGVGLCRWEADTVQLLGGGERFASVPISGYLPAPNGHLVLVTQNEGLFRYDPNTNQVTSWQTEVDLLLAGGFLYHATQLPNGQYALAGLRLPGVVVINPDGTLAKVYTPQDGLFSNAALFVAADPNNHLWVGSPEGLVHLEHGSPMVYWGAEEGLPPNITDIQGHPLGGYFFTTRSGIGKLEDGKVEMFNQSQAWELAPYPDVEGETKLIAATFDGIVEVGPEGVASYFAKGTYTLDLEVSQAFPGRVYVSTKSDHVQVWEQQASGWVMIDSLFSETGRKINHLVESPDGTLWCSVVLDGPASARFGENGQLVQESYYPLVDSSALLELHRIHGHLIFSSPAGTYTYDSTEDRIISFADWPAEISSWVSGGFFDADQQGDYWLFSRRERNGFDVLVWHEPTQQIDTVKYARVPAQSEPSVLADPQGGFLWLGTGTGIYRYPMGAESSPQAEELATLERYVFGPKNSIVFRNQWSRQEQTTTIDFSDNQIEFFFSTNQYVNPTECRFRYWLKGQEGEWSAWSIDRKVRYTNLRPGHYHFCVQSKNGFGAYSAVDSFQFSILAPWYQRWWAFVCYAFGLVIMVGSFIRLRTKKLRRDKLRLEEMIRIRTLEVRNKNEQLESQNAEIQAQTAELLVQKEFISEQKDEIEMKNLSITSSIKYAQRIQEAILPRKEVVRKYLPDTFIYYQPKDIVSGDFYWFYAAEDAVYVAAVDCTGHGVPGAFVSLLANDMLQQVVQVEGYRQVDEILEALHEKVVTNLHQRKGANKDGMDMALCKVSKDGRTLWFAGAKNPLVVVKENAMQVFQGDKKSIGGSRLRSEIEYQVHQIEITEPTQVYLYSDGFQDQFGGNRNRKYMVGKFRDLLMSIAWLSPSEQESACSETLRDWKGKMPQTDDILVMGFRLGEDLGSD
ncbi:MAG: SpoIIE family protein phosphatase [Bacteroidota bacterium]